MAQVKMNYHRFKKFYCRDFRAIPGTYDAAKKTILVDIPDELAAYETGAKKATLSSLNRQGGQTYCLHADRYRPAIRCWNTGKDWNAIIETESGTIPVPYAGNLAKHMALEMIKSL